MAVFMIQHLVQVTGITDASEACKTGDTQVGIQEGPGTHNRGFCLKS